MRVDSALAVLRSEKQVRTAGVMTVDCEPATPARGVRR
jgi:hypothetical protein